MPEDKLNLAIAAFKFGDKSSARQILSDLIKNDPKNENAWLWLSACLTDTPQKVYCLKKALEINPSNQNAQKALSQLQPKLEPSFEDLISEPPQTTPPLGSIANVSTVLICPSCGGKLKTPENTDVIHCMFCGTKILLSPTERAKEHNNLRRFRELLDVAMKAGNYKEAVDYCNSILGIEPKDVDTWIIKARAVCNSSTESVDRYDEGIEYLRKANQINPDNVKIQAAFEELTAQHAQWYLVMASRYSEKAGNYMLQGIDAAEESIQAMEYAIKALKCQPDNFQAREGLELMVRGGSRVGIQYGREVYEQLQILEAWRAKKAARRRLPGLQKELKKLSAYLAKLKTENGLFTGTKIKNTEADIQRIKSEIQTLEKAMSFEVPKAQL
jgi:tetratricopeptide (TPR) repeat protein